MDKTYVFDSAEKGGFDSSAIIASLMQNRGIDPNLMAMLTNASKNQDAWGGNGFWWIWVIIMFWLWGGNGNMFNRGQEGLPNQLNNDFGRDILLQAINGNGQAISQLASTLNCDINAVQGAINQVQSSIQSVGSQVGMTSQQVINAVQANTCQIGHQIAECCCNIKNSITSQGYENQLATVNQTNALQGTMTLNNQAILARLDALSNQALLDKIDALREKNSTLTAQLSNEHQTAAIQTYQAQSLIPVNGALADLSARLGKIECNQPMIARIPYTPAMGSYIPITYSQPVSLNTASPYTPSCGC